MAMSQPCSSKCTTTSPCSAVALTFPREPGSHPKRSGSVALRSEVHFFGLVLSVSTLAARSFSAGAPGSGSEGMPHAPESAQPRDTAATATGACQVQREHGVIERLLGYLGATQRDPMWSSRLTGDMTLRAVLRSDSAKWLIHAPPRTTRPTSHVAGGPEYGRYQLAVHSQTLPPMSRSPNAPDGNEPTSHVPSSLP